MKRLLESLKNFRDSIGIVPKIIIPQCIIIVELLSFSIQFVIDYDKKLAVMRDAAQFEISLSTVMRRMVEIYLNDPAFRKRILQYNPMEGEF